MRSYRFDPAKLPEAHAQCLKKFIRTAQGNTGGALGDVIIVDNTNSTVAEIAPYYAIAEAYGYDTRILRVRCRPRMCKPDCPCCDGDDLDVWPQNGFLGR